MKRVGLLGGAFNPPHEGHLKLARLALDFLNLDELRFVPTAQSPHKPDAPGPDSAARKRLLEHALEGFDPKAHLETIELERGGTSYTVDTLEALAQREPGTAWILAMGSDQLAAFPGWRRPDRIVQLASLAVALRPGALPKWPAPPPGLTPVEAWSGRPGELVALPSTDLDLASTGLRERLQEAPKAGPEGLPTRVLDVIRSENMYR